MRKKVIFLMGPGHCGSTLLDLIIGSHSEAFSLGEIHRIWNRIDNIQGEFPVICGVCDGKCEFWNKRVSPTILKILFSKKNHFFSLLNEGSRYVISPYKLIMKWSGKTILIDSSKHPYWIKKQLSPSYVWHNMEPYLIYMNRDGRAVVNSYFRKYPEKGIESISTNWKRKINEMDNFYERFPKDRRMSIQYEELATQPERVLQSLCNTMGFEYEPEMLRYWKHEHHHVFGNGGTRSLIFKYREYFKSQSSEFKERVEQSKKHYDASYYDEVEIGIKLDQRWRRELSQEQLNIFNFIAGEINQRFVYEK